MDLGAGTKTLVYPYLATLKQARVKFLPMSSIQWSGMSVMDGRIIDGTIQQHLGALIHRVQQWSTLSRVG